MKPRLPSLVFTAFEGRVDGNQEDTLTHFKFDQSTCTSGDALALRAQISAAIRHLTLVDDFCQALSEFTTREMASDARKEEMRRSA